MPGSRSGADKDKKSSRSKDHSRPDTGKQSSRADKEVAPNPKRSKGTERQELRRDKVLERICAQSQKEASNRLDLHQEVPEAIPGPSVSLNISEQLTLDGSNISVHLEALWEAPMAGTSAEVSRDLSAPGPSATFTPTFSLTSWLLITCSW